MAMVHHGTCTSGPDAAAGHLESTARDLEGISMLTLRCLIALMLHTGSLGGQASDARLDHGAVIDILHRGDDIGGFRQVWPVSQFVCQIYMCIVCMCLIVFGSCFSDGNLGRTMCCGLAVSAQPGRGDRRWAASICGSAEKVTKAY